MSLENLKCPNCGSSEVDRTTGRTYRCVHCGSSATLSQDRNILILAQRLCPDCDAKVREDDLFCVACGATLMWPCPSCQKDVPIEAKFCSSCGNGIELATCYSCQASVQVVHRTCHKCNAPLLWNCPNCDRDVRVEASKCRHCNVNMMPKTFPDRFAQIYNDLGWRDVESIQRKMSSNISLPDPKEWIVAYPKVGLAKGEMRPDNRCLVATPTDIILFQGRGMFSSAQELLKLNLAELETIDRKCKNVWLNKWKVSFSTIESASLMYELAKHIRNTPYSAKSLGVTVDQSVQSQYDVNSAPGRSSKAGEATKVVETKSSSDTGVITPWHTGVGWTVLVAIANLIVTVVLIPTEAACLAGILWIAVPVAFFVFYRKQAIQRVDDENQPRKG